MAERKQHVEIITDTANRMSIDVVDEDGGGTGYRLAGRKFDGTGRVVVRAIIDERAAKEIRSALDRVFPQEGSTE